MLGLICPIIIIIELVVGMDSTDIIVVPLIKPKIKGIDLEVLESVLRYEWDIKWGQLFRDGYHLIVDI